MNKQIRFWLGWGVVAVLIAFAMYYGIDVYRENTVIPATEFGASSSAEVQVSDGPNKVLPLVEMEGDSTEEFESDTTIIGADGRTAVKKVKKKKPAKVYRFAVPGQPAPVVEEPVVGSAVAVPAVQHVGRQLSPGEFHINHKLNARLRFTQFFNTFGNGDYVSGKDLASVYSHDKDINAVVRKVIVSYLEGHIDYLQRQNDRLVIFTIDQKTAESKIHVPLLIDSHLSVEHRSAIVYGETFLSKEEKFKNVYLLPLEFKGIEVNNSSHTMPSKGFVSGDYFYVGYSNSIECYKLK